LIAQCTLLLLLLLFLHAACGVRSAIACMRLLLLLRL
jgi:hypothetical protein